MCSTNLSKFLRDLGDWSGFQIKEDHSDFCYSDLLACFFVCNPVHIVEAVFVEFCNSHVDNLRAMPLQTHNKNRNCCMAFFGSIFWIERKEPPILPHDHLSAVGLLGPIYE